MFPNEVISLELILKAIITDKEFCKMKDVGISFTMKFKGRMAMDIRSCEIVYAFWNFEKISVIWSAY